MPPGVPGRLGSRPGVRDDGQRFVEPARLEEDLPLFEERCSAFRRIREERQELVEVGEGGTGGVAPPRGPGGAPEVLALLLLVPAAPVVERERVERRRVRERPLEVVRELPVQAAAHVEGEALVRHLVEQHVLEEVRELGLGVVERGDLERAHLVEIRHDGRRAAEAWIEAGQPGDREHAADDARHAQDRPLALEQLVEAAEDERVQVLRQLDARERGGVARVEPAVAQVVQQLLEEEGISLGAGHQHLDEFRRHGVAHACREELGELGLDGLRRFVGDELAELDAREARQGAQAAGEGARGRQRAECEEKDDARVGEREGELLEEVVRQRVDPVVVLEDDEDRLFAGAGTQAILEQRVQGAAADHGLERAREVGVR